jgi:hypothetical protein
MTVRLDTVHTAGAADRNDTGSPDEAEADKVTGSPTVMPVGGVKEMLCVACPARTWDAAATSCAGAYTSLPPWTAVITQRPGVIGVTADPETLHTCGVSERNVAVIPEVVGADNVAISPTVIPAGSVKEMVCVASPPRTCDVTAMSAGANLSLPPWEAVTTQVPVVTGVRAEPETVHTAGVSERKMAGPPWALACRRTVSPTVMSTGIPKEICCVAFPART